VNYGDRSKWLQPIFPMTKNAFKQSWSDVVERAGIADLTFHDLRREAGSRFDEAGLTKAEHDLMMGHSTSGDMHSLYINSPLQSIQDKLDRYEFDGKTFHEAYPGAKTLVEKSENVEEARRHGLLAEAIANVGRMIAGLVGTNFPGELATGGG
jgi:hypothetical protein